MRMTAHVEATPSEENPELAVEPADPASPREVVNPGDPGPTVLVPPEHDDPRKNPDIPPQKGDPTPGV